MFEIVFLGTSASAPSIHRGLTSQVILAGEHRFMIDCGEGTQRQLLRSGIGFKKLNQILLTHSHLDHILGLGGLVSTLTRWESMDELEIWGGKPALERVAALIFDVALRHEKPPMPIRFVNLRPGIIFEAKDFTVSAFRVKHRGTGNFGFVFEEKARRPFLAEKAGELGIPAGPERGELVRGASVTLADGRTITPDMVLGDVIRGTKLVYVGDVARTDEIRGPAENADALVIEATFLDADAELARTFGHITAKQSAILARESSVRALLLNHISRRYRERDIIQEARSVFPESHVVRDFDHYIVHRDKPVEKKDNG